MKDLGKVMITPKGSYSNDTKYEKLDLVEYNGSSYIALKEISPNSNIEPGGGRFFRVLAIAR